MARACQQCNKKAMSGHSVSHSKRHTKRRFYPNLQMTTMVVGGIKKRVKLCAKCIKTNQKNSKVKTSSNASASKDKQSLETKTSEEKKAASVKNSGEPKAVSAKGFSEPKEKAAKKTAKKATAPVTTA